VTTLGRIATGAGVHARRAIALLALATAVAPFASLEAQSASGNKQERKGFWISVGGGVGSLGCDDCGGTRESGGTAQIALGGTLSQRFQLGVSSNAWSKDVNGVTITMTSVTALAKFYPSATGGFFLQGGLGVGALELKEGSLSVSEDGTSAILGLGYDIRVARNFSITPFINGIGASFDGNGANFNQIGVSLSWH
jgi:hypothetical protein